MVKRHTISSDYCWNNQDDDIIHYPKCLLCKVEFEILQQYVYVYRNRHNDFIFKDSQVYGKSCIKCALKHDTGKYKLTAILG